MNKAINCPKTREPKWFQEKPQEGLKIVNNGPKLALKGF